MQVQNLLAEGNQFFVEQKYGEAIKKFNSALQLDPQNVLILWFDNFSVPATKKKSKIKIDFFLFFIFFFSFVFLKHTRTHTFFKSNKGASELAAGLNRKALSTAEQAYQLDPNYKKSILLRGLFDFLIK